MNYVVPALLALVALFGLSGCSDRPEVETYRLVYPAERETPAVALALAPDATAADLPEGHPPLGGTTAAAATGELPDGHPPIGGGDLPAMPAPGTAPVAANGLPPAAAAEYTWKTPAGWVEKPGASMRLVTFEVPADSGKPGDCSVIKLGGMAGGFVANINRWRGQIGLPAATEAEVMAAVERVPTGLGVEASVVLLVNDQQGILAAIVEEPGSSLFIKLFSDPATLQAQGAAFRALVQSFAPAKAAE